VRQKLQRAFFMAKTNIDTNTRENNQLSSSFSLSLLENKNPRSLNHTFRCIWKTMESFWIPALLYTGSRVHIKETLMLCCML